MTEPSVFISYADDDSDWVRLSAQALADQDVRVWRDAKLAAGESWSTALETALRSSDAIIVVLSGRHRDRRDIWFDLGAALGMGKRLIPVVPAEREGGPLPFDVRSHRYVAMREPETAAREVAEALRGRAA